MNFKIFEPQLLSSAIFTQERQSLIVKIIGRELGNAAFITYLLVVFKRFVGFISFRWSQQTWIRRHFLLVGFPGIFVAFILN